MSLTGHMSVKRGKRVKVYLRNGDKQILKFKQYHAKAIEFYDAPAIPTNEIRTLSIYKEKS